jgi:hypothetical protein
MKKKAARNQSTPRSTGGKRSSSERKSTKKELLLAVKGEKSVQSKPRKSNLSKSKRVKLSLTPQILAEGESNDRIDLNEKRCKLGIIHRQAVVQRVRAVECLPTGVPDHRCWQRVHITSIRVSNCDRVGG